MGGFFDKLKKNVDQALDQAKLGKLKTGVDKALDQAQKLETTARVQIAKEPNIENRYGSANPPLKLRTDLRIELLLRLQRATILNGSLMEKTTSTPCPRPWKVQLKASH
jgi:hypothetical protein